MAQSVRVFPYMLFSYFPTDNRFLHKVESIPPRTRFGVLAASVPNSCDIASDPFPLRINFQPQQVRQSVWWVKFVLYETQGSLIGEHAIGGCLLKDRRSEACNVRASNKTV